MVKNFKKITLLCLLSVVLCYCTQKSEPKVQLAHGVDESAGGDSTYIITTPSATYYLEKKGGGLSSMLDKDGVDWLGFHKKEGSGHKGEYRGFPNAIHKQDGSYFHAMNAKTDPSSSVVELESDEQVSITFNSDNQQWQGKWDFYLDRCDFTMSKISPNYKYWVQYEGVPGGEMDATDFWFASIDEEKHGINEPQIGDLPAPEWMAFGDQNSPRVLYLLHHEDDEFPDNYVSRPDMTVLGFGRANKDKYLTTVQTFSIGFVESKEYAVVKESILLGNPSPTASRPLCGSGAYTPSSFNGRESLNLEIIVINRQISQISAELVPLLLRMLGLGVGKPSSNKESILTNY